MFVPESKAGIMKKKKAGYKTYRTKSAAKKTKAVATAAKKSVAKAAKKTVDATKSGTMKISMRSFATSVFAQNTLPKYKSCYREYTEEDINEAIELVHGGMPVIDAALKYGIPRATLFNRSRDGCKTHSGRCSEVFARTHTGGSSCKKPRSKPMQYTLESVEKAIEAVHAGMPVIDASILYQIPRATLFVRSSRGCPSHAGRCSTVFSNGKIRRTKAPKHKYLTLMQKRSMQSQAASSTQTSREVLVTPIASIRGVPIVDATTGQVMQFKREPSVDNALMGVETGHATFELENVDLAQPTQAFNPLEMSDSTSVSGTPLPSSIVVKIERASDDEN